MGGHLLMSHKELERKSVLELLQNKHITLRETARRIKRSYRQTPGMLSCCFQCLWRTQELPIYDGLRGVLWLLYSFPDLLQCALF